MHELFTIPGLTWLAIIVCLPVPMIMAIGSMRVRKGQDVTEMLLPRLSTSVGRFVEGRRLRIERTRLRKPFGLVGVGLSRRSYIAVTCTAEKLSDEALSFQLARAVGMVLCRKSIVFVALATLGFVAMNVSAQIFVPRLLGTGVVGLLWCCAIAVVEAVAVMTFLAVLDVAYDVGADRFAARVVGGDVAIGALDAMIADLRGLFPPRFALFWVPIELRRDSLRRWIARQASPEGGLG